MPDYVVGGTALALATGVPLAWKWQLGVLRACVYLLAVSMLVAVALTGAGRWLAFTPITGALAMWGATLLVALASLLIVFFRDPDRPAPVSATATSIDTASRYTQARKTPSCHFHARGTPVASASAVPPTT